MKGFRRLTKQRASFRVKNCRFYAVNTFMCLKIYLISLRVLYMTLRACGQPVQPVAIMSTCTQIAFECILKEEEEEKKPFCDAWMLLTWRPCQFERKQARNVCVSGERWMSAVQRKWFRSLFQIRNQPFLQAMTADINCGTCDFLLPAQIMIVWTTGALAPCTQCHRKRCWLCGQWMKWVILSKKKHRGQS